MTESAAAARAALAASLARIAAGDRAALADCYARTSTKLFTIILRILSDRQEAEDVLQDVYLTVWNKAALYDSSYGASPISWLAAVARNRALDRLRQRGRAAGAPLEAAQDVPDDRPSAEAALAAGQESQRLQACLDGLDARAAGAIRAAFFGGMTYERLAAAADMPLATMKSVIRRGLIRLKACLTA
jgi:RNA polymerase sigma-70 factor (ECF subfamily)